jgi:uncharacterized protein involved in exopolysaccharide biosynthesis
MTDNKDINQKLQKMEEQLDAITSSISNPSPRLLSESNSGSSFSSDFNRADEIDLRELFGILWQGKWWIIGITFVLAVVGVAYGLNLPNIYQSTGIFAPAQKQGRAGALSSQLGGLAAIAGVNLGGGDSNDIDQAMALITSWSFLESLVQRHNLKPMVLGLKGWDNTSRSLIWDTDVYEVRSGKWVREPPPGKSPEPSSYETYKALREMVNVRFDVNTALVTVTIAHYSPEVAQSWVELLVSEVNRDFQSRDMKEAKRNISYLQEKIQQTGIAEMQAVFYGMIEAQMKTLMLAEVGDDYLLRPVVTPKVAEIKSKPARALIALFAAFLGCFLSTIVVLGVGLQSRYSKNA